MNKFIIILLLFAQASMAQGEFERANKLYRQEKYAEAATAYESILKTKKHSAELYFNIGNCYYKMGNIAPSIWNFEKALLLDPDDRDVKTNLQFARKMMVDEVREVPLAGFSKLISNVTSTLHYDSWAWIAVGFSVMVVFFFAGYYLSAASLHKRVFFIGMFVWAFFGLLSIFAAWHEQNRMRNERPAIIFESVVAIKSEPKAAAADVVTLHEGTKVFVLEKLDSWRKVLLPDGNDGWIPESAIREIK